MVIDGLRRVRKPGQLIEALQRDGIRLLRRDDPECGYFELAGGPCDEGNGGASVRPLEKAIQLAPAPPAR